MPFRIEPRAYDDAAVVPLIAAVQQEYVDLYGGVDDDPTDPRTFTPPHGLFLLGLLDGRPVATGGFRRLDDSAAEIKRMFVAPEARGRGLGRRMLTELEAAAWRAGVRRIVLNTGYRQPVAMRLYDSTGYERVEGFGHYADQGGARFYAKELRTAPSDDDGPPRQGENGPFGREVSG